MEPREIIAREIQSVCSDGNSDSRRVVDDIIRALTAAGYTIAKAGEPTALDTAVKALEKMEQAEQGLANAYSATYNDYYLHQLALERIGLQKGIKILREALAAIRDEK